MFSKTITYQLPAEVQLQSIMINNGDTTTSNANITVTVTLTSGSGDKGTPVILIQGYFDNFASE